MSESTLYPPPRPLTVGEVLDRAFRIYRSTFVKCLVFGALVVVSNWLPNLYSIVRGQTVVQSLVKPDTDAGRIVMAIVGVFLAAFVFPLSMTMRQYRMITGQGAGGELARTARRLVRIILILILLLIIGLACGLFTTPAFLMKGFARATLFVVLLLPAVYVFVRFGCTFTVMVVEDQGAAECLARSWQLTSANVLRLFAIYTVAGFLLAVLYIVIGSLTAFLYAVFGRGDIALVAAALGVVTVAAGALATPYYSALALAIFGDLVVRKEGADLSQRISAS